MTKSSWWVYLGVYPIRSFSLACCVLPQLEMERTHEEAKGELHPGTEGRYSEEAFGGRSADLGSVSRTGAPADGVLSLAEGVLRERSHGFPAERTDQPLKLITSGWPT